MTEPPRFARNLAPGSDADPTRGFRAREFTKNGGAPDQGSNRLSDLLLDRYVAGELSAVERHVVEQRIAADADAQARVAARRQGFEPGFPKDAMLARILTEVEGKTAPPALTAALAAQTSPTRRPPTVATRFGAWLGQRWWTVLGAAATGALVAFVVVRATSSEEGRGTGTPDDLRVKGGLGITIYRQTGDGSEVVLSGADFHSGDKLRFELTVPEPGFAMVVDLDPQGTLGPAWPLDSGRAGTVEAGKILLPGAVALDGAVGTEWLIAVLCPRPFAVADLQVGPGSAPGTIVAPAGCTTRPFELKKVAR